MMKKKTHSRQGDNQQFIHFQALQLKLRQKGFTLLELMVVLVIGGILSAIALPSFANYTLKAKETEARLYVSAINKDQQRYFMENSQFSGNLAELGLGIPEKTQHYEYKTTLETDPGTGEDVALTVAGLHSSTRSRLRPFSGQVWYGVTGNSLLTTSVLCEGDAGADPPSIANNQCQ